MATNHRIAILFSKLLLQVLHTHFMVLFIFFFYKNIMFLDWIHDKKLLTDFVVTFWLAKVIVFRFDGQFNILQYYEGQHKRCRGMGLAYSSHGIPDWQKPWQGSSLEYRSKLVWIVFKERMCVHESVDYALVSSL